MPEMPTPVVTLAEGDLFVLFDCGAGASYVLRSKEDGTAAHFQGEDIAPFLGEYEAALKQYPQYTADQILAQLWDQGGYMWQAVPDDA